MSEMVSKSFEFGPGTPRPRSHMRTFYVPAGSRVRVAIEQMELNAPNGSLPVIIEIRRPSLTSIGASGPDGPLVDSKYANAPANLVTFSPTYTSELGCPSTWRVRVRAAVEPLPVKISGTIAFFYDPPDTVLLDMVGADTQHLDSATTVIRTIRPRAGSAHPIAGTGRFRIRAKWHTDPFELAHIGHFHRLTVALLRPNDTVAGSETGFSRHASSSHSPKVDFQYTVTPDDARMSGDWGLRIANNSGVRVVDFDINRGIDPNPALTNFESTFKAACL